MCLEIETNGFKRIAEEDITVYKVLNKDNTSSIRGFLYGPGVQYTLNAVERGSFEQAEINSGMSGRRRVHAGFHAYTTSSAADASHDIKSQKTVAFTIPKSAHYYLGSFYEIAADTIIAGDLTEL